jgi:2-phosphosulfolactate phosphatase
MEVSHGSASLVRKDSSPDQEKLYYHPFVGYWDQRRFDIRFEWGLQGLQALSECRTFIIIDILSFTTCVSIALAREAIVFPYRWKGQTAQIFADEHQAVVTEMRDVKGSHSLSPKSLLNIQAGTRIVLPSPNGATLAIEASELGDVLVASFRNRSAIAAHAGRFNTPIAIIAAGEQWPNGYMRIAYEDFLGSGALIAKLPGTVSPEAQSAADAFLSAADHLQQSLRDCGSGLELIQRGFPEDVDLAAILDCETPVPRLVDSAFEDASA